MDHKIPNADGSPFGADGRIAVGIEVIDRDHEEIFRLIEVASGLIGAAADSGEIRMTFERLLWLCREHFALEEALMRTSAYPQYEQHRDAHDALLREGTRLLDGGAPVSDLMHKLLDLWKGWSLIHVMKDDQSLGQFLAERGR